MRPQLPQLLEYAKKIRPALPSAPRNICKKCRRAAEINSVQKNFFLLLSMRHGSRCL